MKQSKYLVIPIVRAFTLCALVITLLIIFTRFNEPTEAVMLEQTQNTNLTESNLVGVFQQYIDTDFVYKVMLTNGQLRVQLSFTTIAQLVEQLDKLIDQHAYLCFTIANNIDYLVIHAQVQNNEQAIYEISISKQDFLMGKEIQIKPLS